MSKTIECTFTSEWSDSDDVVTKATYNQQTGEVSAEQSNEEVKGCLLREYITLPDHTEKDVCTTCHEYVMKTEMNPGIGKTLVEETVCSNPECDSNQ